MAYPLPDSATVVLPGRRPGANSNLFICICYFPNKSVRFKILDNSMYICMHEKEGRGRGLFCQLSTALRCHLYCILVIGLSVCNIYYILMVNLIITKCIIAVQY